jgi:hypothetical protein
VCPFAARLASQFFWTSCPALLSSQFALTDALLLLLLGASAVVALQLLRQSALRQWLVPATQLRHLEVTVPVEAQGPFPFFGQAFVDDFGPAVRAFRSFVRFGFETASRPTFSWPSGCVFFLSSLAACLAVHAGLGAD